MRDVSPILWIYGGPGCGKSVLASFISEELFSSGGNVPVVYFFFDDKDDRLNDAKAALRNLLAQLLEQDPDAVFKHFLEELEFATHRANTSWSFGMLWRVFERIIKDEELRPIRIVIDALGISSRQLQYPSG